MLNRISNYLRSRVKKLDERASATMMIWIPVLLMFSLFLWIGMGVVMDRLSGFQSAFAASSSLPVSSDRVWLTGMMINGYSALLIFSVVLPICVFGIVVAKRRMDSGI